MRRSPPVGGDTQPTIRIVLDLPAPFGPRNPNASPGRTSTSMPATAVKSPNCLRSPRALMSGVHSCSSPPCVVEPTRERFVGTQWIAPGTVRLASPPVTIRDLTSDDLPAVWAINQANTPAVGDVTPDRLAWIVEMATINLVATDDDGTVLGFCNVLPQGTEYTSVNYRWFCERYDSFVVPRSGGGGRGRTRTGHRRRAVRRGRARAAGTAELFTLEVNLRPRNDGSLRFHDRLGFVEVGQQETDYGILVSMLAKPLP